MRNNMKSVSEKFKIIHIGQMECSYNLKSLYVMKCSDHQNKLLSGKCFCVLPFVAKTCGEIKYSKFY